MKPSSEKQAHIGRNYFDRGWIVQKTINGVPHSRNFNDRKCGGKDKSLIEAMKYRDNLYREHFNIRFPRKNISTPFKLHHTNRVQGISEEYTDSGELYYKAAALRDGYMHSKAFYTSDGGKVGAFREACKARIKIENSRSRIAFLDDITTKKELIKATNQKLVDMLV